VIFSSLAPEQLKALEVMGAQKALEVLQAHIVRYLKERMGKKKRKKAAVPGGVGEKGGTKPSKADTSEWSSPFTTVPLPSRTSSTTPTRGSTTSQPLSQTSTTQTTLSTLPGFRGGLIERPPGVIKEGVPSSVDTSPPVPVPIPDISQTPVVDIDGEDDEEGRVTKRRKLGNEFGVETVLKQEASVAQLSQATDEDIEVDVC